jgi:hypothetical protein
MKFKVEVMGLDSWTMLYPDPNAKEGSWTPAKSWVFRRGVHIVEWDDFLLEAANRVARGHSNGEHYGVYVTRVTEEEPVTGTSNGYHDYPPGPTLAKVLPALPPSSGDGTEEGTVPPPENAPPDDLLSDHGAVETKPGVFEVKKANKGPAKKIAGSF